MRAENKVIIQNKGTAINYFSNIRPQFVLRARWELLLHWHGWGGLKWITVSEYIFVKTIIKSNFRFFLEINFLRWKERCSKYLAYKSAIMRSIDVTFCRFRSVIFLFHFSHNVSCVHYLVTVTDRNDFFKYVIFSIFFSVFRNEDWKHEEYPIVHHKLNPSDRFHTFWSGVYRGEWHVSRW